MEGVPLHKQFVVFNYQSRRLERWSPYGLFTEVISRTTNLIIENMVDALDDDWWDQSGN